MTVNATNAIVATGVQSSSLKDIIASDAARINATKFGLTLGVNTGSFFTIEAKIGKDSQPCLFPHDAKDLILLMRYDRHSPR